MGTTKYIVHSLEKNRTTGQTCLRKHVLNTNGLDNQIQQFENLCEGLMENQQEKYYEQALVNGYRGGEEIVRLSEP